jgi:chromosomal replication initiation ATPase DnaA
MPVMRPSPYVYPGIPASDVKMSARMFMYNYIQANGVSLRALQQLDRRKKIVEVRSMLMYVLREHFEMMDYDIGGILEKDRTTVCYHVKKTSMRLSMNDKVTMAYYKKALTILNRYPYEEDH